MIIIYNKEKTQIIENPDLSLGYLKTDTITRHYDKVEAVEEKGHFKTIAEYPNGGKDVEWVVDVPAVQGVEEHDEIEHIQVYIPYTKKELEKINAEKRIKELKKLLCDTDYLAIKFAEGELSEEEYSSTREQRRLYRKEINELESI